MTPMELMFGRKPNIEPNMRLGKGNNEDNICDPDDSDYEEICGKLPTHNHSLPNILTKELQAFNHNKRTKVIIQRERDLCQLYKRAMKMLKIDNKDIYENRNISFTGSKLKIGDLALVENKEVKEEEKGISRKLLPLRKGVYKVIDIAAADTYILLNINSDKRVMRHRNQLLPYNPLLQEIGKLTEKYPHEGAETEFLLGEPEKWNKYEQKIKHLNEKFQGQKTNPRKSNNTEIEITFNWDREFRQLDEFNLLDSIKSGKTKFLTKQDQEQLKENNNNNSNKRNIRFTNSPELIEDSDTDDTKSQSSDEDNLRQDMYDNYTNPNTSNVNYRNTQPDNATNRQNSLDTSYNTHDTSHLWPSPEKTRKVKIPFDKTKLRSFQQTQGQQEPIENQYDSPTNNHQDIQRESVNSQTRLLNYPLRNRLRDPRPMKGNNKIEAPMFTLVEDNKSLKVGRIQPKRKVKQRVTRSYFH